MHQHVVALDPHQGLEAQPLQQLVAVVRLEHLEQGVVAVAPHPLDFVQLVMGEADPLRVHVEAARHQSGWRAEDEAMILLAYADRCLGLAQLVSYIAPENARSIRLAEAIGAIGEGPVAGDDTLVFRHLPVRGRA